MSFEGVSPNLFSTFDLTFFVKVFLIVFLVFYIFFAIILFRQILIMNRKLPTPLSAILKFVAFVHIGVSLALVCFVIGSF